MTTTHNKIDTFNSSNLEAISDIGVSRKRNEDSVLYMEVELSLKDKRKTKMIIMLVCDGMGGLSAGNWASSYCCHRIEETIKNQDYQTVNGLIKELERSIFFINNDIVEENKRVSARTGKKVKAGTTMTLLIIHDGIGHLRHLGDTRLYEIIPTHSRDFSSVLGENVEIISQDQSEVMREVRAGRMTYEQAMSSNRMNILYMCLGVFPSSKLKIFKLDFQLHKDASYLIGTDGFWHGLSDSDLVALASRDTTLKKLTDRKKDLDGEKDNISALIYRFK